MVTRSEGGISLFHQDGKHQNFPVRVREVKDVTGAGDTVLAMLTCALASGISLPDAVQLSNIAAGMAIERFGCARITLSELARRLLEEDVENKVFDEEHLFALKEALRGRKWALLGISTEQGMTSQIFKAIRQIAQKGGRDLLVYIRDPHPDVDFVNLLASLHEIDFIILKRESLQHFCETMSPEEVFVIENDSLKKLGKFIGIL